MLLLLLLIYEQNCVGTGTSKDTCVLSSLLVAPLAPSHLSVWNLRIPNALTFNNCHYL